jgi:CBS domain-containing protein
MFSRRLFSSKKTISDKSALGVFQNSCYHKIDFKINEEFSVREAVVRFVAFNIGCLAVTNSSNKVVGVCSERDFITKVACMDKNLDKIKVKDICTYGPKIIVAEKDDTLDMCLHR